MSAVELVKPSVIASPNGNGATESFLDEKMNQLNGARTTTDAINLLTPGSETKPFECGRQPDGYDVAEAAITAFIKEVQTIPDKSLPLTDLRLETAIARLILTFPEMPGINTIPQGWAVVQGEHRGSLKIALRLNQEESTISVYTHREAAVGWQRDEYTKETPDIVAKAMPVTPGFYRLQIMGKMGAQRIWVGDGDSILMQDVIVGEPYQFVVSPEPIEAVVLTKPEPKKKRKEVAVSQVSDAHGQRIESSAKNIIPQVNLSELNEVRASYMTWKQDHVTDATDAYLREAVVNAHLRWINGQTPGSLKDVKDVRTALLWALHLNYDQQKLVQHAEVPLKLTRTHTSPLAELENVITSKEKLERRENLLEKLASIDA